MLEFIAGQIASGALPPDQEVIKGTQELAALTSGERSDRAWLALATLRPAPAALLPLAAARPRLLWRLHALLQQHHQAIHHFFLIENPSEADVNEFFEYLRNRVETEGDSLELETHLPSLIELLPQAAANLLPERLLDSVATHLRTSPSNQTLEFAERLLEMGRLRGDAAVAHLRALCLLRPGDAAKFLKANPGIVRPEEALAIVQETGASEAEAICLEAVGDPDGALDAILRRAATSNDKSDAIADAVELCARVTPAVPPAVAADMWTRLLGRAGPVPPALLLEAGAYVPVQMLVERSCESRSGALALVACAASRRRGWACAARLAAREAHEALARALSAARRGVAVRGRCGCGRRLAARPPVHTTHCARARHADCPADTSCALCGRRVPDAVWLPPPRPPRRLDPPPLEHALTLVAPPRPDLEGLV